MGTRVKTSLKIFHFDEGYADYAGMHVKIRGGVSGVGVFACWKTGACVRDVRVQEGFYQQMANDLSALNDYFADHMRDFASDIISQIVGSGPTVYLGWYSHTNRLFVFPVLDFRKRHEFLSILESFFGEQNSCPVARRIREFELEVIIGTEHHGNLKALVAGRQSESNRA